MLEAAHLIWRGRCKQSEWDSDIQEGGTHLPHSLIILGTLWAEGWGPWYLLEKSIPLNSRVGIGESAFPTLSPNPGLWKTQKLPQSYFPYHNSHTVDPLTYWREAQPEHSHFSAILGKWHSSASPRWFRLGWLLLTTMLYGFSWKEVCEISFGRGRYFKSEVFSPILSVGAWIPNSSDANYGRAEKKRRQKREKRNKRKEAWVLISRVVGIFRLLFPLFRF